MRWIFLGLGWTNVALGVIGAFLPVMPTTIFMLMAMGCFARSSPRLERWLLDHPRFGPSIRDWRNDRSMSLKHKVIAVGSMLVSGGIMMGFLGKVPVWIIAIGLVVIAVGVGFVLTRKTRVERPQS
ncbi:DUF454 domain-containing protein [candidate division BRC1 bacterium HGW-BRC1-1]|jgi:hypothetical protein|nr:MAG: DUF454 domain-containing protein [candidate division BRC1 bacterium HGW-BRC1-1]